jgi:hypothetical protein
MPHPAGKSPHQLRKRRRVTTPGQGISYVPVENTEPTQPEVRLHFYMPEDGESVMLGQENEVTGKPGQAATLVIYTTADEARAARARLELLRRYAAEHEREALSRS